LTLSSPSARRSIRQRTQPVADVLEQLQ
jgi:hypothetical protein